eukprot:CAMPEP_0177620606 /NCGR_PEP_ID=MMETSP0419_2-20121207/27031_1 /TAXON_ID=582737 /ORGANISM="Tetraselmis sp., Strain GSL018" /LENGTH=37 /DNA_ID= /DNA_START= /DNA_END= /DNA_ORIENTATION=
MDNHEAEAEGPVQQTGAELGPDSWLLSDESRSESAVP